MTNADTMRHWHPGEQERFDGECFDPKDHWGPEFDPDDVLEKHVRAEINYWLKWSENMSDPDIPKTIAAKIVFRGETWTARAKIEKDAEIDIVEAE